MATKKRTESNLALRQACRKENAVITHGAQDAIQGRTSSAVYSRSPVLIGRHTHRVSEMASEVAMVVEPISDGDLGNRMIGVEQIIAGPMHPVPCEELHGGDLKDLLEFPLELIDGQEHEGGQVLDLDRLAVVSIDVLDDGGKLPVGAPSLTGSAKIPRDAGDPQGVIVPGHERHLGGDVPVDAAFAVGEQFHAVDERLARPDDPLIVAKEDLHEPGGKEVQIVLPDQVFLPIQAQLLQKGPIAHDELASPVFCEEAHVRE